MSKIQYKIDAFIQSFDGESKSEEIFEYILVIEPRLDISLRPMSRTLDQIISQEISTNSKTLQRIIFNNISDVPSKPEISSNSLNPDVITKVIAIIEADLNLLNYAYLVGDEESLSKLNDALIPENASLKIINKENNNNPIGFQN